MKFRVVMFVLLLTCCVLSAIPVVAQHPQKSRASYTMAQRMRHYAAQSRYVVIYGEGESSHQEGKVIYKGGKLWNHLTQLKSSFPDDSGLLIKDKALIQTLLRTLQFTDKTIRYDYDYKGAISFDFTNNRHIGDGNDTNGGAFYVRHGRKAYCLDPGVPVKKVELRHGSGPRFEAFVHRMAKLARRHSRRVSFLRYDVYELAPS